MQAVQAQSMEPIKYIGHRDEYTEGAYGSRILFKNGETKLVDANLAKQLLKHPDVYEAGDIINASSIEAAAPPKPKIEDTQDIRDEISNMNNSDALISWVYEKFQQKLDKRQGLPKLKNKAIQLIDLYGID